MDSPIFLKETLGKLRRSKADPPGESQSLEVPADNPPHHELTNERVANQPIGFIFSEFHMTIRLKVLEITQRELSMLLAVAVTKAASQGVDVALYLTIEQLFSMLTKSGVDPMYTKEEKLRQTVMLAELVLLATRGHWLSFTSKEMLDEDVVQLIYASGWLPNDRTLNSWRQHWDLEKYLEVKIVPVDIFLERQPTSAERYSGYIRGYGQDGSPRVPHKTKDEPEDGNVDIELPAIPPQEYDVYSAVLDTLKRKRLLKTGAKL